VASAASFIGAPRSLGQVRWLIPSSESRNRARLPHTPALEGMDNPGASLSTPHARSRTRACADPGGHLKSTPGSASEHFCVGEKLRRRRARRRRTSGGNS